MPVSFERVSMAYGGLSVLDGFDCAFADGQIHAILGPSGSGKTTLLNIAAGLLAPDAGRVTGADSRVSYIFQQPRLLPHMSVRGNVEFVLRDVYPKGERAAVSERALRQVRLWDARDAYPGELSGGMAQRVAIARAFAFPSGLLLMDEPFKELDLRLRGAIFEAFVDMWDADRRTVLCVTHTPDEALLLSDRILLCDGPPLRVTNTLEVSGERRGRHVYDPELSALRDRIYIALGQL